MEIEFYCPYCKGWINNTVHRQHQHNYHLQPDRQRDWRLRVDGVVYEDETDYVWTKRDEKAREASDE